MINKTNTMMAVFDAFLFKNFYLLNPEEDPKKLSKYEGADYDQIQKLKDEENANKKDFHPINL